MPHRHLSNLDEVLSQIASEVLGVPTLKTRHSDSLDFWDLPVWLLSAALKAAYRKGREAAASEAQKAPGELEPDPATPSLSCSFCHATFREAVEDEISGSRCPRCGSVDWDRSHPRRSGTSSSRRPRQPKKPSP